MRFVRRIRPEKTGVRAPLGDLEQAVMRYVWDCGDTGCLASEVQRGLERERPIALTTVLTTVDRLFDKGILKRGRDGKAYRYHAALTEEQLQQRIVEGVLGDLIAHFPKAVAAYFTQQGLGDPDASAGGEEESLARLAERLEAMGGAPSSDDREKDNGLA